MDDQLRSSKSFVAVTGLALVIVGVSVLFITTRLGGSYVVRAVDDLGQGLAAGTASVAAAGTARRQRHRRRWGWALLSFGLGMWAAGQALWCWWELVERHVAPFPSPADIGFLSFSLSAAVGVYLIADDRGAGRLRFLLDGFTVAGGLLVVSWTTALGAAVRAGSHGLPLVVSLAYPITDVVLLTMTVQMLARAAQARSSLLALGAATVCLAVADSSYTYLASINRYHTGDPLDLGWIGGFALIAVAAAASRPERRARRTPHKQLVVLPYAVLLVALTVVVGLLASGRHLDDFETSVSAVMVCLVLIRQYLTVRDNQELVRTVEAREAELSHQAFHDDLTGLPNRALFNDRVGHALELHRSHRRPVAVLFCDLDDFKVVNDTLGHRAGDELLVRVAERLRGAIRPGDTLSRLGGDEFAVLVEGAAPVEVGHRICNVLIEPFMLDGRLTRVRASIGIAGVGESDPTPSSSVLLAHADTAMYAVKRSGKAGSQLFHPNMSLAVLDDADLREALTEALVTGAVRAVYQPIVDPVSGRVHALEALARWTRDGEPVSPPLFVGLAERLGLVHLLTDHMLNLAVRDLAAWSAILGHDRLRVSVNVSASELTRGARLPARVATALTHHAVRSDQLVLEITESAVTADPARSNAILHELREIGVHVALDDFGVGQSSLSRLREFPIDYLKLDGEMVRELGDATHGLVARSMIALGQALGMHVVVEGVELAEQLAWLVATDTPPLAQGYALARPTETADVPALLAAPVAAAEV